MYKRIVILSILSSIFLTVSYAETSGLAIIDHIWKSLENQKQTFMGIFSLTPEQAAIVGIFLICAFLFIF